MRYLLAIFLLMIQLDCVPELCSAQLRKPLSDADQCKADGGVYTPGLLGMGICTWTQNGGVLPPQPEKPEDCKPVPQKDGSVLMKCECSGCSSDTESTPLDGPEPDVNVHDVEEDNRT